MYWWWTTAAYALEMPVINFQYNRYLASQVMQRDPDSPFFAKPKYMIALPNQPRPNGAQLVRDFDGVGLWKLPGALPFAFSGNSKQWESLETITPPDVSAVSARFDGPNRIVVTTAATQDDRLVVLVSDYPGWHLSVDGKLASVKPLNGYLGAALLPGAQTYTFSFHPVLHDLGLLISAATLLLVLGMLFSDLQIWRKRAVLLSETDAMHRLRNEQATHA